MIRNVKEAFLSVQLQNNNKSAIVKRESSVNLLKEALPFIYNRYGFTLEMFKWMYFFFL